ncbi:hypothetical protein [Streptomyces sp. AB3(2024)]|uniref:hypothetical protein n=1 Tax=Streptomyces sp. AB3(2024) TaxID=3317321 RepID=UPI0035A2B114
MADQRVLDHRGAGSLVHGQPPLEAAGVVTEFVLDGEAVTVSRYAVHGRLDPAPLDAESRAFGRTVLDATAAGLLSAVCLDIGRLADGGRGVGPVRRIM